MVIEDRQDPLVGSFELGALDSAEDQWGFVVDDSRLKLLPMVLPEVVGWEMTLVDAGVLLEMLGLAELVDWVASLCPLVQVGALALQAEVHLTSAAQPYFQMSAADPCWPSSVEAQAEVASESRTAVVAWSGQYCPPRF